MARIILFGFLAVSIPLGVVLSYFAQQELTIVPTIDGILVDDDGRPVAGKIVDVESFWNGYLYSASGMTTESDGSFSIPAQTTKSLRAQILARKPNIDIYIYVYREEGVGRTLASDPVLLLYANKTDYKNPHLRFQNDHSEGEYRPLIIICGINSLPESGGTVINNSQCKFNDTMNTENKYFYAVLPADHSAPTNEIEDIFNALEMARETHNQNNPEQRQAKSLDQYAFQLIYDSEHTDSPVTIQAAPPEVTKNNDTWHVSHFQIDGGGNSYFSAQYNRETREIERFYVHREW